MRMNRVVRNAHPLGDLRLGAAQLQFRQDLAATRSQCRACSLHLRLMGGVLAVAFALAVLFNLLFPAIAIGAFKRP
jgi:hypothetical protein